MSNDRMILFMIGVVNYFVWKRKPKTRYSALCFTSFKSSKWWNYRIWTITVKCTNSIYYRKRRQLLSKRNYKGKLETMWIILFLDENSCLKYYVSETRETATLIIKRCYFTSNVYNVNFFKFYEKTKAATFSDIKCSFYACTPSFIDDVETYRFMK